MSRGIFITLEGGEGVGKTTQINLLKDKLIAQGHDVVVTREPGGTPAAEEIRNVLSHKDFGGTLTPDAELMLLFAARETHMKELIQPAIQNGKTVICDRFIDSTRVYQGILQNVDMDFIRQLEERVVGDYMPNLTLLLDITAEKAMARVQERGAVDHYDKGDLDFYKSLRDGFSLLQAKEPQRIKVIEADNTIDTIADNIWQNVQNIIENNNV